MADIGRRTVVVLSRDAAIPRLRRTLVAPCTTTIRNLASGVVLDPASDPIPRRSAVNFDSVESVLVAVLVTRRRRGGLRSVIRQPVHPFPQQRLQVVGIELLRLPVTGDLPNDLAVQLFSLS